MNMPLLYIHNLSVNYEQYKVLSGIDMEVHSGEIVCILGKNGSGKSTLLKSIVGLTSIRSGEILLNGTPMHTMSTKERIHAGVGYLMQHNALFPRLSVEDHILLAAQHNGKQSLPEIWSTIAKNFPTLVDVKKQIAGRLSGGQSRFLGVAMLVAQGADTIWLLDEPSAGIAKNLLETIGNFLKEYISRNEITCLLVEQNRIFGELLATRSVEIHHKHLSNLK